MEGDFGAILRAGKTIAVVGLSRDPSKESYSVAEYMRAAGFRIVPVNPMAGEIMGLACFPSLTQLPDDLKNSIDIVDIFRRSEDVPPVVDEAIELKKIQGRPNVIWMQSGIVNQQAAKRARDAGMEVVMDRCVRTEHRRLLAKMA